MTNKLVVGNWKMNGSLGQNAGLLASLASGAPRGAETAVCVPYPYLAQAAEGLRESAVAVGAQNVSEFSAGAYTGEVSAAMLRDFGCRYVIVGHSERRTLFGEQDIVVARKTAAVLQAAMTPIVCIGESLSEREGGQVETVLLRQLAALVGPLDVTVPAQLVVAYEPVWAIGTGKTAQPDQVQEVLALVRRWFVARGCPGDGVRILYGGSVKADNAGALFSLPDCDGGLIGGASLVAADFLEICRAAE